MVGTVWDRLGLWRLTRSGPARTVYDRLTAAGVTFARLDRFVRPTASTERDPRLPESIDGVERDRARDGVPPALDAEPMGPEDLVLRARRDDRTVGYCLLSDRPIYVPELGRRLAFPGAYLWRVFVVPDERGRGIGTALVESAVDAADEVFDAESISALVAPDNVPSRRAFASAGFSPGERYTTVGVGERRLTRGPTTPEAY